MTTLPERPDGGVDTARFYIAGRGICGPMFSMDLAQYTAMIEANERARCAKWHDDEAQLLGRALMGRPHSLEEIIASEKRIGFHKDSAAAFRKMEG